MASAKTYEERIAELNKKQEQIKAQKRALISKVSAEKRKERTKRLIEIGAAVEFALSREIEKKDLPKLISFLKAQEERGGYVSRALEANTIAETDKEEL